MLKVYKKFFAFSGIQKNNWYKGLLFEILRCIFESMQFVALFIVIKGLVEDQMNPDTPFIALGIMVFSILGSIIMWYFAHRKEGEASYKMCENKRLEIGERMKYIPMGYFNSHSLGNITSVATATMQDLESMAFAIIVRTLVGIIHAFILSISITIFEWHIGLIFIAGIIVFMLINSSLLKKSHKLSPRRLEAQMKLMDAVLEYIQGMNVVKAFRMDKTANNTLKKVIQETEENNFKVERKRIPYIAWEQIILRVTSVLASFMSIVLFLNGQVELFTCLLMLISSFMIYSQLEIAGEMFFMLPMIDASINKVNEINNTPLMDSAGKNQKPKDHNIVFKNVGFSYGSRKIINNVTLKIPQGKTTAFVGPSGCGKTTLCNLIARFWDVDEGMITLGGVNIKDYTLDSLMSNISMVFQKVYLFNDTIENNIKFGNPSATYEEVVEAAKKACCHDFIKALPNGYKTVIGEGGATISGGEKQRISIARAIMKDAPIIILDEATANVDPENEEQLQTAIEALTLNKTIIMIAHRLKTVKKASQIVVIDNGEIVQCGKHKELINEPGIYSNFVGNRKKAIDWKV